MNVQRTDAIRLALVLAALALWRVAVAWHRDLELYADEAQYWFWSLSPDWGYYSKPPVIAWLIQLGTQLFGHSELAVRSATFAVWTLTPWVIFLTVRRAAGSDAQASRAGFWAAILFASLPMTALGSQLITTDGPLLLFWALSLYALVRALEEDRLHRWVVLGLFAGLGLMSKYSMAFFALAFALFALTTPTRRSLLLRPGPYVGALVAAGVFAPNVLWNLENGLASFRHTAEISQVAHAWLHPAALAEFFAAQFAVAGPVVFAGLLGLAWTRRSWTDGRMRLFAVFCFVPLAAFFLLALLSRAFANWAAFAYVAGVALFALFAVQQGKTRWLGAALAVNLVMTAALYHYPDVARLAGVELTRKTDPTVRLRGFRELGQEVQALLAAHPGARLLADDRKTMASLLYYTRPAGLDARYLNPGRGIDNHFALTRDVAASPRGSFILVSRHAREEALTEQFAEVHPLGRLRVPLAPDATLEYAVWRVRDYRPPAAP